MLSDAIVQRARDAGELELVDEVREADEIERVAQRRAANDRADLNSRAWPSCRPRQLQARQADARRPIDLSDLAVPFTNTRAGAGCPARRPGPRMNALQLDRRALGSRSTRDSQIDAT